MLQNVLLVIHLMIAASLVGVVLLQRSEGGALGIGGGGGGGFLTGRGTANLLTRVTAGLAAGFFFTSLALTVLAQHASGPASVVGRGTGAPVADTAPAAPGSPDAAKSEPGAPATPGGRGGILDRLQGTPPAQPSIPQSK